MQINPLKLSKCNEYRNLQIVPENTGLDVIHDNRSGEKLEIVLPVFNEEKRIGNILNYYKNFDIVLMDDGSTDRTIELAIQGGATVYRRVGESIGENHFTYYANKITKSGYCFYMMADEFIEKSDLKEAYRHLQSENAVIGVRKIEWIYGEEPRREISSTLGMARGFRRGDAVYDPFDIHNSLHYTNNPDVPIHMVVYDLHHLHIKSMKDEYGKFGRYLYIEIEQMRNRKSTFYRYLRRFVFPIVLSIFWRVWFNKTSLHCKLFKIMEMVIILQLAIMCWIEQKFMPGRERQLTDYSTKYFMDRQ